MKVLILDIETAPHLSHTWGLFDQTVGLPQLLKPGYILCVAAKWHGEKKMHFYSVKKDGAQKMLEAVHRLMDEADVVVGWNSKKFDVPWLVGEFLTHGLKPPAPFKQVDLMEVAKRRFKFASNRLAYVATALKLPQKVQTGGHQLWIDCMNGKSAAWKKMREYNEHDVALTEMVYEKFKGYVVSHPNHGASKPGTRVCPNCGSDHLQARGMARTMVNTYQRYQCMGCGAWSRSGQTGLSKNDRSTMLRSAIN